MVLIAPEGRLRLRLAAAGDLGLVGSARARAAREGYDAPLRLLADRFRGADLAFANLEFPLGARGQVRPERTPEFFHDAALIPALARAGVTVLSLATNHMMDCGPEGLIRTLEVCAREGIQAVGAGPNLTAARRPARIERSGQRVCLLAYAQSGGDAARPDAPGVAPLEAALMEEDLRRWRPEADLLVVSAHWGSMYIDYPPPRVLELARRLAAAGADLVLGHHPHVLQGAARLGPALILYSLGDAVFNSRAGDFRATVGAETRRLSGVFRVDLADRHGVEYSPHRLDEDGFPVECDAADGARLEARLHTLTEGLVDAERHFAEEGAAQLLQYEWEGIGHYLRQGRLDKILRLILNLRPRHLPVLWKALRRGGRSR